MRKKLTITLDEQVYDGLKETVGSGKISKFIENLVRPHILKDELDLAYSAMAKDKSREKEALEWCEISIDNSNDSNHETR